MDIMISNNEANTSSLDYETTLSKEFSRVIIFKIMKISFWGLRFEPSWSRSGLFWRIKLLVNATFVAFLLRTKVLLKKQRTTLSDTPLSLSLVHGNFMRLSSLLNLFLSRTCQSDLERHDPNRWFKKGLGLHSMGLDSVVFLISFYIVQSLGSPLETWIHGADPVRMKNYPRALPNSV